MGGGGGSLPCPIKLIQRYGICVVMGQRVQPTRGRTVAAQRSTNCTHPSCPQQWGPVSTVFLGSPAKWTRWLVGAAAIKSG